MKKQTHDRASFRVAHIEFVFDERKNDPNVGSIGGRHGVDQEDQPHYDPSIVRLGLGQCFGPDDCVLCHRRYPQDL